MERGPDLDHRSRRERPCGSAPINSTAICLSCGRVFLSRLVRFVGFLSASSFPLSPPRFPITQEQNDQGTKSPASSMYSLRSLLEPNLLLQLTLARMLCCTVASTLRRLAGNARLPRRWTGTPESCSGDGCSQSVCVDSQTSNELPSIRMCRSRMPKRAAQAPADRRRRTRALLNRGANLTYKRLRRWLAQFQKCVASAAHCLHGSRSAGQQ